MTLKRKLKKLVNELDVLFDNGEHTIQDKFGLFYIRKSRIGLLRSLLRGLVDNDYRKHNINYIQAKKLWAEMMIQLIGGKNERGENSNRKA